MENTKLWLIIVLVSCALVVVSSLKCDRTPEGSSAKKSPPDGRYKLKIQHDPQRFIAGESYNSKSLGLFID
jgi:spondin-1